MKLTMAVICAEVSTPEYGGMEPGPVLMLFVSWLDDRLRQELEGVGPWQVAQIDEYS